MSFLIKNDLSTLQAKTQAALESFTGSPIKKQGKVRGFLADMLGFENEHVMKAGFESPVEVPVEIKLCTVSITEYDSDNDEPTSTEVETLLFDSNSHDKANEFLLDIFKKNLPDNDSMLQEFLDIQDFEAGVDCDKDDLQEMLDNFWVDDVIELIVNRDDYNDSPESLLENALSELTFGRTKAIVSYKSEIINVKVA